MGQRLNIEIKKKDKVLANCYYHWSAYSESALELTKIVGLALSGFTKKGKELLTDVEKAVVALTVTGAGIQSSEMDYAKTVLSEELIKEATNRNYGLICISEEGIKNTRDWAEGTIVVDIESMTFDFDVYSENSWYEEDKEEPNYIKPEDLPVIDFSFNDIPLTEEKIDELLDIVKNTDYFRFKEVEGVYCFIA